MELNDDVLNEACLSGNIDLVKECLFAPRVNITNNDNKPLINAVYGNNPSIVQLLLSDIRPDPSARNNRCIKLAIENGNLSIVKLLMSDWRVSLDEMAYKLLYITNKVDKEELISYVVQNDKAMNADKAIMLSIIDNDINKFTSLLPQVGINARNGQILTIACNLRRSEMVKLILADPRLILREDQLPLLVVLDISVLKHINNGGKEIYNRLLRLAIDKGLEDTVEYLLQLFPHVDIEELCKLACSKGCLRIFKMLYNPDLTTNYLVTACTYGRFDIVKFLASHKDCDISSRDNEPLSIAVNRGDIEIVEFLLRDERLEVTPDDECIDIAVSGNRASILRLLLQDGRFDPSVNDNWPLKLASEKGYEECVNLLLDDTRVITSM